MLNSWSKVALALELPNKLLGNILAWLMLAMMFTMTAVVALRAFLNLGSVFLQDSITYMHAALFMLAMAYTLQRGAHVRVDIFYRRFNIQQKAWVDVSGALIFLLPFSFFLIYCSWDFAHRAWSIREVSSDAGGIPAVFILKTLIPLSGALLIIQGLAEVMAAVAKIIPSQEASEPAHD